MPLWLTVMVVFLLASMVCFSESWEDKLLSIFLDHVLLAACFQQSTRWSHYKGMFFGHCPSLSSLWNWKEVLISPVLIKLRSSWFGGMELAVDGVSTFPSLLSVRSLPASSFLAVVAGSYLAMWSQTSAGWRKLLRGQTVTGEESTRGNPPNPLSDIGIFRLH